MSNEAVRSIEMQIHRGLAGTRNQSMINLTSELPSIDAGPRSSIGPSGYLGNHRNGASQVLVTAPDLQTIQHVSPLDLEKSYSKL